MARVATVWYYWLQRWPQRGTTGHHVGRSVVWVGHGADHGAVLLAAALATWWYGSATTLATAVCYWPRRPRRGTGRPPRWPQRGTIAHRAGHGAVTSPLTQRGYTAVVHTRVSCIIGANGIHVGTMGFGKMEGDASDMLIAYMLSGCMLLPPLLPLSGLR